MRPIKTKHDALHATQFSTRSRRAAKAPHTGGAAWRLLVAGAVPLLLGVLLGAGAPLMLAQPAGAQSLQAGERAFTNRYARPGRPTMTVYVWGQVGNTGIWKVERDVDLIELLSAVQVPGLGEENPQYKRSRVITIYRQEGGGRNEIYQQSLEEMAKGEQNYPPLQEGDILEVSTDQSRRFSFSTIVQYVGTASSLVLLVLRLTRL